MLKVRVEGLGALLSRRAGDAPVERVRIHLLRPPAHVAGHLAPEPVVL